MLVGERVAATEGKFGLTELRAGIPYPAALSASVSAAVCASRGVEIAQPLLLQKRITGAFITAAKFAPSWNAPSDVAPSPKVQDHETIVPSESVEL